MKTRDQRPKLVTVGIRKDTQEQLQAYVYAQNPRPIIADVVSLAVEKYIEEQGGM